MLMFLWGNAYKVKPNVWGRMSSDFYICHVATCLLHLHRWVHRGASITHREIKVTWIFAFLFGMLIVWESYSHLFVFTLLRGVKCHACTFHAEGTISAHAHSATIFSCLNPGSYFYLSLYVLVSKFIYCFIEYFMSTL